MNMKIFYVNINESEELGLQAVSLVDRPAIEKNFLCFKDEHKLMLSKNESEHIISGPALIPDLPIYRFDAQYGEYYVVFTADTIKELVLRYNKNNLINSVNLQHNADNFQDGVICVEEYFINKERGIVPKGFEDLPDGTWMLSFKVLDDELWKQIVNSDEFNGFSVEVISNLTSKLQKQEPEDELSKLIDEILENK